MNLDIYKSSAGSGKTYTLVRNYLSLVLRRPSAYRNILAITFTNKAAGEMKQRIITALHHLSAPGKHPDSIYCRFMLPDLKRETGFSDQKVAENAAGALQLILHDYTNFAVSTIDSFTHRIIRTFSFDLHLPHNFELETDTEGILERVTGLLIDKAGLDEGLTSLLVEFIQFRTDDDKSWHIENDIASISSILFKEDSIRRLESIKHLGPKDFQKYIGIISRMAEAFEEKMALIAQKAVDAFTAAGIGVGDFYFGNTGIGRYFARIAGKDLSSLTPNTRVQKTIEDDVWYTAKADPGVISAIDSVKEALRSRFEEIQEEADRGFPEYLTCLLVRKTIYPVAMLNEVGRLLEEYRKANNILFISEFNALISKVIEGESAPFIYERAGQKFSHIMIDEFQDTSVLQWENMLPLIENSLGSGGSGMLVGDPKQAIYRWRNGDVEQFLRLVSESGEQNNQRERFVKQFIKQSHLDKNFRSGKAIVDFNNDFFTMLSGLLDDDYKTVYSDCRQESGSGKSGGFVRIQFLDGKNSAETELLHLEKTLIAVDETLKAGYSFRDIAILCRTNVIGLKTAAALLGKNIPVISSDSLLLNSSPDVRFLVSMLRYYKNPGDRLSALEAATYLQSEGIVGEAPWRFLEYLGDKENNKKRSLISWLREHDLSPAWPLPAGVTLYDLVEGLTRDFGLAGKSDPFIQFFLDHVLEFMDRQSSGIADFLEWWDEHGQKKSIVIPEKMDAVRVMTIHKAKGLEFPVVIFPFATETLKLTNRQNWSDVKLEGVPGFRSTLLKFEKSMEDTPYAEEFSKERSKSFLDMLNLLYVCMTRPTDRLYVLTGGLPKKIEEYNSLPVLFHYYLSEKGIWEEGQDIYDFGEPDISGNIKTKVSEEGKDFTWISLPWQDRLLLSLRAPGNWDPEPQMDRKGWGTLVHEVLSQVKIPGDVDKIVDKYLVRGFINEEEKNSLKSVLESFFHKAGIGRFFAQGLKVMRESEILDKDGRSWRPDRLVFFDDETAVVDFKTGKREPGHEYQIRQYARLIENMGYRNVRKYLMYIHDEDPLYEVQ